MNVHRVRFPRLHDVHHVGAWGMAIPLIEQLRVLPELLRGPVEAAVAECVPNPFEVIHAFGIWHFAQDVKAHLRVALGDPTRSGLMLLKRPIDSRGVPKEQLSERD